MQKFLRALTAFVGLYHVLVGAVMMWSGEVTLRLARSLGGAEIAGSPELGTLSEILACYLVAFGLMMGMAAWDPVRNRSMLSVGCALFVLRVIQRVWFAEKTMAVFHTSSERHWGATVVVVLLGAALGYLRWTLAGKESQTA